jgi:hypothetical protein
VDDRLRCAVDANVGWHKDICAMHGVESDLVDGLWWSRQAAPRLHSDAVVVETTVRVETIVGRLADRGQCAVKDSFASVDLSPYGFRVLFTAMWLHHRPTSPISNADAPTGWSVVTARRELEDWNRQHETADVLPPSLLGRAHFRVLAKRTRQHIVAGAVARFGSGVVDISNVFAIPGEQVDWAELGDVVHLLFPNRSLVGYESGDQLGAATSAGFTPVGPLRVWQR